MTENVPLFTDDLRIFDDVDDGIRIECAEKYVQGIRLHLAHNGIDTQQHELVVRGTPHIHNLVRIPCDGKDYDSVKNGVRSYLDTIGVTHVSKEVESEHESWCEVILTNQSHRNR